MVTSMLGALQRAARRLYLRSWTRDSGSRDSGTRDSGTGTRDPDLDPTPGAGFDSGSRLIGLVDDHDSNGKSIRPLARELL